MISGNTHLLPTPRGRVCPRLLRTRHVRTGLLRRSTWQLSHWHRQRPWHWWLRTLRGRLWCRYRLYGGSSLFPTQQLYWSAGLRWHRPMEYRLLYWWELVLANTDYCIPTWLAKPFCSQWEVVLTQSWRFSCFYVDTYRVGYLQSSGLFDPIWLYVMWCCLPLKMICGSSSCLMYTLCGSLLCVNN